MIHEKDFIQTCIRIDFLMPYGMPVFKPNLIMRHGEKFYASPHSFEPITIDVMIWIDVFIYSLKINPLYGQKADLVILCIAPDA